MTTCDVAILGAGPYGLSAAAHLNQVKGLDVKVFGEPMEFWKSQMPEGMYLRSPWAGSHLSDPGGALTMDSFRDQCGNHISTPIPLDRFVEYGLWFQKKAVPAVDHRRVSEVASDTSGFRLTLADGEEWKAARVVIACGIGPFARRLAQFHGIPKEFVTHSSDQRDVRQFAGKRVVVIGAGQSALESAALIQEAHGDVEVIVRESEVHWLGWRNKIQRLGPLGKLLYSPVDVGPAGVSRIVAKPDLVKYFPRGMQDSFRKRSLRPAGAKWLMARCKDIPMTVGKAVESAILEGDKIRLKLSDGSVRVVDHVVQGTGYKVDVSRYPFFPPAFGNSIRQVNGFPVLSKNFETSIPGLHILGAPAAWTFGPLLFFVAGTDYATRAIGRYFSAANKP
jgi:hypothetical protein